MKHILHTFTPKIKRIKLKHIKKIILPFLLVCVACVSASATPPPLTAPTSNRQTVGTDATFSFDIATGKWSCTMHAAVSGTMESSDCGTVTVGGFGMATADTCEEAFRLAKIMARQMAASVIVEVAMFGC